MINSPLVSVLMTSYNREKYIGQAIESVLASTYNNFELIIVDDKSSDKTVEITRSFAAADSRIKVYINDQNLGDYSNRNKAAAFAKGKYLKYVDSDDYIYPYGIEQLVFYMEQFPDAGYGLCSLQQNNKKVYPFELTPKEAYNYHYFGPGLFYRAPLSSIIKREAFEELGGFTPIRMSGDFDMWHKLSQKFNVVLMPQGIVWYREHGEQEMNSYSKYELNYEKVFLRYLSSPDCPLDENVRQNLLLKRKTNCLISILKNSIKLNYKKVKSEFVKYRFYHEIPL
ncbi:glycosyltransferase family A protein [Pontibacter sp. H259]|uniref:glycosyltransferase family 2 protein n=1 Tax=Pontibacter sp. H259 TaxID=3133421 RepID=UPI0030BD49BB